MSKLSVIKLYVSIVDNISKGPTVQLKPSLSASSISIYLMEMINLPLVVLE